MSPELQLLQDAPEAAAVLARRLSLIAARLSPLLPFDAGRVTGLNDDALLLIDAALKRFENLADILGRRVLRGLLLAENEAIESLSSRDLAALAEKLSILPSAARWSQIILLRNRLAHDYPRRPDRQAESFNLAAAAIRDLLETWTAIEGFAARRGHAGPTQ